MFGGFDLGPDISISLPSVNLEGVGNPLNLLNSLFPGGASISVNSTDEPSGNSPFFFLLGDNNRASRRVEEDVRRLFGRALGGNPPVASLNRWTDDGQQPLQSMI